MIFFILFILENCTFGFANYNLGTVALTILKNPCMSQPENINLSPNTRLVELLRTNNLTF